jgi:hypothetical protein
LILEIDEFKVLDFIYLNDRASGSANRS